MNGKIAISSLLIVYPAIKYWMSRETSRHDPNSAAYDKRLVEAVDAQVEYSKVSVHMPVS